MRYESLARSATSRRDDGADAGHRRPFRGARITETNATPRLVFVKTFDELYTELLAKAATLDPESGTVRLLSGGVHAVGKKVVEEAAEVWMAAEHEGSERTAEEIAQLVYHLQVMMLAADVSLDDVYRRL